MSTDTDAELHLAGFARDLVLELAAAEAVSMAAGLPKPPKKLPPRQRGAAEAANPEYRAHGVTPDRPGAERHCDYCGSARAELVPGADGEDGAWLCRDERQCLARKEHRWPPRPDLVLEGIMAALAAADEDDARRREQYRQQAVQPAQQREPERQQQETMPGWQAVPGVGAYNLRGDFIPALPAYDAYAHTLMHPANRTHLLSGQQRPHYYGGAGYVPPGVVSGAESARELPGGTMPPAPQNGGPQPPAGGQGTPQREVFGVPPGPARGAEGGDRVMGQQFQAAPVRGVQPKRRKLRYTGRRQARKHPGTGGSDSFGNSPDTGGPSGSASSAEVT
jgi:hypothetical protein